MKKFFLILIVLIFIQFSHTYSQNCPQGTGTWYFTNINYTDFYGNNGQVDYKYRTTAPFQI